MPFPRLLPPSAHLGLRAALALLLAAASPAYAASTHARASHRRAPAPSSSPSPSTSQATGVPVVLQQQRGTPLAAIANQLVADDLADARASRDRPLVLVGMAALGGERPALFIQLQSPRECGSAGCTTSVFEWQRTGYKRVLDGTTGKIIAGPKRTKGRLDLISDDDHYVWTGSTYNSLNPAPPLDLRPRTRR